MGGIVYLQSTARSGTAWLGSCLATHPKINWLGEMFHPVLFPRGFYSYFAEQAALDPATVLPPGQAKCCLDYLAHLIEDPEAIYGIDLKLEHLQPLPNIHSTIFTPTSKFIVLRRLNLLKQAISEFLMFARLKSGDNAIHRGYVPEKITVTIPPGTAIAMMRAKVEATKEFSDRIRHIGAPCLSVFYEDTCLPGGIERTLREIEAFLELEHMSDVGPFVKQNPFPPEELVSNWPELSRAVAQTELAYTLHLMG